MLVGPDLLHPRAFTFFIDSSDLEIVSLGGLIFCGPQGKHLVFLGGTSSRPIFTEEHAFRSGNIYSIASFFSQRIFELFVCISLAFAVDYGFGRNLMPTNRIVRLPWRCMSAAACCRFQKSSRAPQAQINHAAHISPARSKQQAAALQSVLRAQIYVA